ncbi:MAG: nucleoside triphosphate pyrophosphohydrolase [Oscillospiraceae bacterium]|nr:nucleoside triphosphate pyrophosphohydrolase [Oscillospiraceae bacterium]
MAEFPRKERYDFADLRRMIEVLRGPAGCPWDAAQDHHSVRRNLLEEAYELAHAIDAEDEDNLKEELGDLMIQVLFHARMEEEQGSFGADEVCDAAVKKLLFRHPHVFGSAEAATPEEALAGWDAAKRIEKKQRSTAEAMEGVAESLPALWRAEKLQSKAAKIGFEWPELSGAIGKIREETEELIEGVAAADRDNIEEELGDLLFTAVNAGRMLGVDPEKALHRACGKYIRRFRFMEETAAGEGKPLETLSLQEMERYYQRARHELEGKEMQ